jgi:hypothetical protein
LTIVGRNTASNSIIVSGTLASLSGAISTLELYQTNALQNLARGADVTVSGGAFSVTIPGNTFFTLVTPSIADSEPPTAPTNLTATNGFGQVQLNWNASTDNVGVAGYSVYRSTTAGFTPSAGNLVAQTVGLTTMFTNNVAAGNYYYRVLARDAAGNLSLSSNEALGISQSDTTAPTVALTAPADNSTLSGSVNITADATDNIAVAGVSFYANGLLIGSEDTTAPYYISWNTSMNPNGSYILAAVARDSSGNQTTSSSRTVTVQNSASMLGLVAQWSFDDGSGTSAQDDSGNGHSGTVSNATWSTTGKYGGALAFNGTNSWVTVADAAALDLTTGMTIEAWVNPTSLTGWRSILLKERAGGLAYSLYATNPDLGSTPPATFINLGTASDTNSSGTQALPLNTWTHLAGTYDGSQLKMYVNGALRQTINAGGGITVSNGVLRIGGNSVYGEYFAGLIDEIRLYNRALTLAEIQTNMSTPVNPAPIVTAIIAAGTAWNVSFIDAVDGGGTGAGNELGYSLTSGFTIPNAGVDRIYVLFSEPVIGFDATSVKLFGVNVADYSGTPGFMTVSYDSALRRGVIQLSSVISRDKLRLGVSDMITDGSLKKLDGDANGSAGGALDFRFNILVGDGSHDGSVNGGDVPIFASSFNLSAGNASYNARADWNSDGSVNGGDLSFFATNFNRSLPSSEPGALDFPPTLAVDEEDTEWNNLYASIIEEEESDEFFAEFESDEE